MFLTKYCLATGKIQEFEPVGAKFVDFVKREGDWNSHRVGKDAFYTRDDAIADANQRRVKKIASLEKQITKLKAMTF